MTDKATIEINCDTGTIGLLRNAEDFDFDKPFRSTQIRKAELVAQILMIDSGKLMDMSIQELMNLHLEMLNV